MNIPIFNNSDFEAPTPQNREGCGQYGDVYRLHMKHPSQEDNPVYAVKILKDHDFEGFKDEIKNIFKLNYKTIIHLHGITLDDPPYMITDYIPNGTVKACIDQIRLGVGVSSFLDNLAAKLILILGISFGMEYLHLNHVAHRDLKPENVLLDSNYYPIITDFGISTTFSNGMTMSTTNAIIGTPLYMAPEMLSLEIPRIDSKKSDVYSFGLTMYAILSNKIPFQDICDVTPFLLMQTIIDGRRPNLDSENIPESMKQLMKRCWANNPKDRPTFKEINDELLNIKDEVIRSNLVDEEGITKVIRFLNFCPRPKEDDDENTSNDETQPAHLEKHDEQRGQKYKEIGDSYYLGTTEVKQDYTKALSFYFRATLFENADAYYQIGLFYEKGYGVLVDYIKAMIYYKKAVSRGHVTSIVSIGNFYLKGLGVPKDLSKAFLFFKEAADKNDSFAQNIVGTFYERGLIVERDYLQAKEYYAKSAEQGDLSAKYNLGRLYYYGKGVKQDYTKAHRYFYSSKNQFSAFSHLQENLVYDDFSCTSFCGFC